MSRQRASRSKHLCVVPSVSPYSLLCLPIPWGHSLRTVPTDMLLTSSTESGSPSSCSNPSPCPRMRYFSSPSTGTSRYRRYFRVAWQFAQVAGDWLHHLWSHLRQSNIPARFPTFHAHLCHLAWISCPSSKMVSNRIDTISCGGTPPLWTSLILSHDARGHQSLFAISDGCSTSSRR